MRLLHIVEGLSPALGGMSRVAANLSELFARAGSEVEIITTIAQSSDRIYQPSGVTVQALPRRFVPSWAYAPGLAEIIERAVANADLIHLHGLWLYPHFVASRAAWRARKPYLVSPHGMMDEWALAQGKLKKQVYGSLIEWRTLQRAAAIHAVSETEATDIKRLGFTADVVTIPNGINRNEFAQLPNPSVFTTRYPELLNKTIFLFLGRLHPKKGLDLLVKAFTEVAKVRSDTALVFAGPDESGCQLSIASYLDGEGLGGRCLFTGMLGDEERLAALSAAHIFVLPSYSEGFPLATIEALAAGLPVILTEACNVPDIEEQGAGIIVKPEVSSLQQAMLRLADDPTVRKQMGINGRQLALDAYSWDTVAERMGSVYQTVLQQQPRVQPT
jgi:glycosyltransferase involved in cell wall biosynthesis